MRPTCEVVTRLLERTKQRKELDQMGNRSRSLEIQVDFMACCCDRTSCGACYISSPAVATLLDHVRFVVPNNMHIQ